MSHCLLWSLRERNVCLIINFPKYFVCMLAPYIWSLTHHLFSRDFILVSPAITCLRKQPTFCDTTTGFHMKWHLSNQWKCHEMWAFFSGYAITNTKKVQNDVRWAASATAMVLTIYATAPAPVRPYIVICLLLLTLWVIMRMEAYVILLVPQTWGRVHLLEAEVL